MKGKDSLAHNVVGSDHDNIESCDKITTTLLSEDAQVIAKEIASDVLSSAFSVTQITSNSSVANSSRSTKLTPSLTSIDDIISGCIHSRPLDIGSHPIYEASSLHSTFGRRKYTSTDVQLPCIDEKIFFLIDKNSQEHIRQLLDKAKTFLKENNYQESERCYAEIAEFAQASKNYSILIECLHNIANIYTTHYASSLNERLTCRQYFLIKAAALYNCLINIKRKRPDTKEQNKQVEIRNKLMKIEESFLGMFKVLNNPYPYKETNDKHVKNLEMFRNRIECLLKKIIQNDFNSKWWRYEWSIDGIQKLHYYITLKMKKFIINLWEECVETVGSPPCKYAIIAFGSIARGETTPYSDFEWGILLKEDFSEDWKLYLISHFSKERLSNINGNALVLTDNNEIYFVKNGELLTNVKGEVPSLYSKDDWDLILMSGFDKTKLKEPHGNAVIITNESGINKAYFSQPGCISCKEIDITAIPNPNVLNACENIPLINNAILKIYPLNDRYNIPYTRSEEAVMFCSNNAHILNNIKNLIKYSIKEYFKILANLLYLKVVNLGETILPAINIKSLRNLEDYVTPRGFTFDGQMPKACKTPFGNKYQYADGYELLGTPKELAEYQKKEWFEKDCLLPSELYQFTLVTGDEEIAKDYQIRMNSILKLNTTNENHTLRKMRGLNLLLLDITNFYIDLDNTLEEGKLYNIKKDLYRLPNTMLDGLGLYYNLQSNAPQTRSGWGKIDEMLAKGLLNSEGASNIRIALSIAIALRLQIYLNNRKQYEKVYPTILNSNITEVTASEKQSEEAIKSIVYLNDLSCLFSYYRILLPLQDALHKFASSGGNKSFLQAKFNDQSDYTAGLIWTRFMQYSKAKESFQNVKTLVALRKLSSVASYSRAREAIKNLEDILELDRKILDLGSTQIAIDLNNLGVAYHLLGYYSDAIEHYLQSIKILGDINKLTYYSGINLVIVSINLISTCREVGKIDSNVLFKLKENTNQIKKKYGNKHPIVSRFLCSMGFMYYSLKQYDLAKKYAIQALGIDRDIYNEYHFFIASDLNLLGASLEALNEYSTAKDCINNTLSINAHIYGNENIIIARDLNNMGMILYQLGDHQKAIIYLIKAILIGKNNRISLTTYIGNLGLVIASIGDYKDATTCFKGALFIAENYNYVNEIIKNLKNLSRLNGYYNKFEKSINYYNKLLPIIAQKNYKNKYLYANDFAKMLSEMFLVYAAIGKFQVAMNYFIWALCEDKKIYDKWHPVSRKVVSLVAYLAQGSLTLILKKEHTLWNQISKQNNNLQRKQDMQLVTYHWDNDSRKVERQQCHSLTQLERIRYTATLQSDSKSLSLKRQLLL